MRAASIPFMKFKPFRISHLAVAVTLLLAGAKEAPAPKPTLKTDPSPVGDGKTGVVVSYADVIEPVQKTVVSIYSKKTVRHRLPPYFRQFFGEQDR